MNVIIDEPVGRDTSSELVAVASAFQSARMLSIFTPRSSIIIEEAAGHDICLMAPRGFAGHDDVGRER